MKKLLLTFGFTLLLAGCAVTGGFFGPTPEAQIVTGANAVRAAATIAADLLQKNRITVAQAKSYSAILHTASGHLDVANAVLTSCRSKTGSTQKASPDPCAASIASDIALAISVVGEVQKTMKAKE